MKSSPSDVEQALQSSLMELVQYSTKQLHKTVGISSDNIAELEHRLVQIGLEIYAPSILMMAGAGANFSDKIITNMISFWFVDKTFQNVIMNKIAYFKWALYEMHTFARKIFLDNKYSIKCKFSCSDPHNLGKETIFFTLTSELETKNFVFKPSCCATQRIINTFMSEIYSIDSLDRIPIQKIEHYIHGEYCIKEFIHSEYLYNKQCLYKYLHRLGILMCISFYTKATDLHFENIISSNCMPYAIDAEVILDDLTDKHEDIVFNSGILQYLHYAMNDIYAFTNIEMNIIDGRLNYTKNKQYSEHVLFKKNSNFLISAKNISILCAGFSQCFEIIKNDISYFTGISNSILDEHFIKLRYISRFTAYYKVIQLKLWTPFPLNICQRKNQIIADLSSHTQIKVRPKLIDYLPQLIKAEMADFDEGDIPFFWLNNAGDLCHRTGTIAHHYKNAHPAKLLESAMKHASKLSLETNIIPKLKGAVKRVANIVKRQPYPDDIIC